MTRPDQTLQDNEELMLILKIVNMVFAVLFTIEMLLKWIAFGLWRYFTSAWTCLDFVIVCVSGYLFALHFSVNFLCRRLYNFFMDELKMVINE